MQARNDNNLIGKTLNERYLVQELIGEGTNGSVYKAEDLVRKFSVAIKVLNDALSGEKSHERFKHGVESASSLAHPNIVRLHSFNLTPDKKPFLVMDFVQGHNLAQVLAEKGSLSEELCISIFTQVCDAMQNAHAKGVVHRNLKPSNIILIAAPGNNYMVKISDFGLAKLRGEKETRQSLAKKGQMLGNPLYMSPEQCTGGAIDERADIYAAGCLMYECLTGKPPYAGSNSFDIMSKHVNSELPEFETVMPQLPHARQLGLILKRAMAKKTSERYQSAGEMSHDMNLINEVQPSEWDERAVCMRPPIVAARADSGSVPPVTFNQLKPVLIGCAVMLLIVVAAAATMAGIAVADLDVKPLMRYKIAVQEIILPANDPRLIRNLNYMTDYLKSQGQYADAWKYKEKVLKAEQSAAADGTESGVK